MSICAINEVNSFPLTQATSALGFSLHLPVEKTIDIISLLGNLQVVFVDKNPYIH